MTNTTATTSMQHILQRAAPVLPVLTIDNAEDAIPLANALLNGGLSVLEITLRTAAALEAIQAIKSLDGIIVGAGTVTTAEQFTALENIGADFAISPGISSELLLAGQRSPLPFLPGVASASEIIQGIAAGYHCFKFFPAHVAGGIAALNAFAAPFPNITFCPTGGIHAETYRDYLQLPNVVCVGGSWIATAETIKRRDWQTLQQHASRIGQAL